MKKRIIAVLVLALAIVIADRFILALTEKPSVGHFRSAEGRSTYVTAYQDALAAFPPEQSTRVPTSFGDAYLHTWNTAATGIPILLVPGRASGAPMWNELLPHLGTNRPVFAVDAIGDAGLSTQSTPLTSMQDQAAWLAEAISHLGLDEVHVVGHSFGGATAAALAMYHPDLVASLTLLEPVFVLRNLPASAFFWATVASTPLPQSWVDRALAEIGGTTVEEIRERTPVSVMIDAASKAYSAALPTPKVLTDSELERLSMPVYIGIADHKSLAGGAKAAERAQSHLPESTVKVWPNTTHSLPFQVTEKLGNELQEFWRASESSAEQLRR
ncbi:putative carboxylesterase nap [Corynebacterium kalinowskii]|uniref:Carboxylesterase nap n=1 Tax=Corynebacterium kalinowskii TaxID=2675216 RepID=A0A6B8V7R1_9CORY|nr:alpha/beta fold hydrolase [Corynebacterium kalinowskii]QGU01152.1 putative carboxylesterase nap [Corynebacterium kalinowskii]